MDIILILNALLESTDFVDEFRLSFFEEPHYPQTLRFNRGPYTKDFETQLDVGKAVERVAITAGYCVLGILGLGLLKAVLQAILK